MLHVRPAGMHQRTAAIFLLMTSRSAVRRTTIANVGLSFVSLLVYTLMAIACGFLLGSVVLSEMAVNDSSTYSATSPCSRRACRSQWT